MSKLSNFIKITKRHWWGVLLHWSIMALIGILLMVFYFFIYLPSFTNHGETVKVPDLKGKSSTAFKQLLEDQGFNFKINDTTWNPKYTINTVVFQDPAPNSSVKYGRTIYITLNSPKKPKVKISSRMVDLIQTGVKSDLINFLEKKKKFKLDIEYRESPFKDRVLEVLYNGMELAENNELPYGARLVLIVGDGNGQLETEEIIEEELSDDIPEEILDEYEIIDYEEEPL